MRHFLTILDCQPWTRSLPLPVLTVSKCGSMLRAALLIGSLLVFNNLCHAQTEIPQPSPDKSLTSSERDELLKLIRSLQERLDRLEAAQASPAPREGTQ